MKTLFIGVGLLFVLLIGVYVFFMRELYADHGHSILVAFGVPDKESIQMHLSVPILTYRRDPPRLGPKNLPLIKEWVEEHYILRDEAGKRTMLKRIGSSSMVEQSRAASAAEFFLFASLEKGRKYTLDFVPIVRETKRYRYEFTAPHEPDEVFSRVFVPVEDE